MTKVFEVRTNPVGMDPEIIKEDLSREYLTPEGCHILELFNTGDHGYSIARARVEPGESTRRHSLKGVVEHYLVTSGQGLVEVGELPATMVKPGDLVNIPAGTPQRITNTGDADLLFYCLCTPGFHSDCYLPLQ